MLNYIRKLIKSIYEILRLIFKGEISVGLYTISSKLPNWLFKFNKATMLKNDNFIFPQKNFPNVRVAIADYSHIEDIVRISGLKRGKVEQMLNSGAKCFLASIKDEPPASVSWSTGGKVFIKGLGFEYDFGDHEFYGYGAITLPEARNKGLYQATAIEKRKYERLNGIKSFYSIIEFINKRSYSLQIRFGSNPVKRLIYLKFLCFKVCIIKDIISRKLSTRIFIKEPTEKITYI